MSKAQKAQNICLEKNLKFLNFFRKMSLSAKKCKRGTLLDLLTYILLQDIKKNSKGGPLGTSKFSKKKLHSAEKNRTLECTGKPYLLKA